MTDALKIAPIAPGRWPGLGHIVPLARRPFEFLQSLRPVGELVRIYIGPSPVYVVNSPELLHRVLLTDERLFSKGLLSDKGRAAVGNGLLTSEADCHRRQRRLMQPAFHHNRIAGWVAAMSRLATARITAWGQGQTIDVVKQMQELSMDIVLQTLFAAELKPATRTKFQRAAWTIVNGIITQMLYPAGILGMIPTPGNLRFHRAAAELRSVFDELLAGYRADDTDRGDIISTLCRTKDGTTSYSMTDEQVRDEAVSILLAGTETTAVSLSWLFYELGQNPHIAERARAEVRRVLGNRDITAEDLKQLDYLQAVIHETMRRHSPNWILFRRANQGFDFGGYRLPPGANLIFSLTALHRDPELYPDPMSFNPDRWSKDKTAPARGTFLPFSTGTRKCIGDFFAQTEIMITATVLLRQWRLLPLSGAVVTESKAKATLQPVGLRMVTHCVDA